MLNTITDIRGSLTVLEFKDVPFEPKRLFYIHGVPSMVTRGGHAHKEGDQFLICIKGKIRVNMETRMGTFSELMAPGDTLLIENETWASQVFEEPDSVLLVVCSNEYDEDDYIKYYQEFKNYIKE